MEILAAAIAQENDVPHEQFDALLWKVGDFSGL